MIERDFIELGNSMAKALDEAAKGETLECFCESVGEIYGCGR